MPYFDQAGDRTATKQMNFWTPERCRTLSTEILLDNLTDFLAQAQNTKNTKTRTRSLQLATMLNAELAAR